MAIALRKPSMLKTATWPSFAMPKLMCLSPLSEAGRLENPKITPIQTMTAIHASRGRTPVARRAVGGISVQNTEIDRCSAVAARARSAARRARVRRTPQGDDVAERTTGRRHCMVVDNYYPDIRVEREARAARPDGHAVDVICLRNDGEPAVERSDGITVYRLPVRRRRGMGRPGPAARVRRVPGVGDRDGHAAPPAVSATTSSRSTTCPTSSSSARSCPKLGGTPILLDLHDLMPEFFASRFGGRMSSLPVRLVTWQERLSAAFATASSTVTELWRRTLIERGQPADRVDVVMNLPDEELFAPRAPQVRAQLDPLTLVYHGTITHRYGIDVLLDALARVRRRAPGAARSSTAAASTSRPSRRGSPSSGSADAVELSTALVPTGDLPGIVGRADIGIVPNRRDVFTDGILPTKLMEYAGARDSRPSSLGRARWRPTSPKRWCPSSSRRTRPALAARDHRPRR